VGIKSSVVVMAAALSLFGQGAIVFAAGKPAAESLLKPRSFKKLTEDYDIITNSEWVGRSDKRPDDFAFVNAVLIRAPLRYARPKIMDFSIYPKMSSAIHKINFDPKSKLLEIAGEAKGFRMHSWIRVDASDPEALHFDVASGDLKGMKIDAYLWDKDGKTLAIAKGLWPEGKKFFSSVVALLFKPVSEVVIGVATKNFRSYIEEEYRKQSGSR
jgi:hypothetical protein